MLTAFIIALASLLIAFLSHSWDAGNIAFVVCCLSVVVILIGIWFLPYEIAVGRGHPEAFSVGVLSFVFGWTLIGWLGAMIWAVAEQPQRSAR